jgi:AP2-associated kinase
MLRENLQDRPNIYQVLKEGCAMQGRNVPVQDVSVLVLERKLY